MPATAEVDAYLAQAPEARREALTRLRELCLAELTGFEEVMAYGMPAYVRAGAEAAEIAWANQKQYISVYLMRTDVRDVFADRLAGHDMGKACLRFRRPEAVDFTLLRDILRSTASAPPGPICT
ncbi:iron chaperone [Streptomyces sp. NPDC090741]|uniref:iron chaperone n=1 Tax=Streptomyces sp. NPDC090741 TaxID=3365967 RepID=UPI0037FC2F82